MAPNIEAIQAVAAARRDAQHVPAEWRSQLSAIIQELRGFSNLALVNLPENGIRLSEKHGFSLKPGSAVMGNDPHQKFFAHLQDCTEFVIDRLALRRGRNAAFLHRCRRFWIINADLHVKRKAVLSLWYAKISVTKESDPARCGLGKCVS